MPQNIWKLTPREAAAQCIMPRLVPNSIQESDVHKQEIISLIAQGIGGFCVFQGDAEYTATLIDELQKEAAIPLLFSADYEHGLTMRLEGGTDFPHAMALAQAKKPDLTYKAAAAIALEAKTIGVHWNFAPVCDINSHPENPIINIRAFAEYPSHAEQHIKEYIKGTQSQSVLACAKHFPGHGNTVTDSHSALPIVLDSLEQLQQRELVPFQKAIEADVQSIMIGHLSIPALDPSGLPASLSSTIMIDLLRKHMKYKGIIITDALDMHAISKHYTSAEATILSLQAGATIALVPDNALEALDAVARKAEEDPDFYNLLVENCLLIAKAKQWCGLISEAPTSIEYSDNNRQTIIKNSAPNKIALDSKTMENHALLALDIAKQALVIHDPKKLLPISEKTTFAAFAVLDGDDQKTLDKGVSFFRVLAQTLENECDFGFINSEIEPNDAYELRDSVQAVDIIILAVFIKPMSYKGTVGLSEYLLHALDHITQDKPVVAMLLGSPYLHSFLPADAYICSYSDSLPSLSAAALTVSGRATAKAWTPHDAGCFQGDHN